MIYKDVVCKDCGALMKNVPYSKQYCPACLRRRKLASKARVREGNRYRAERLKALGPDTLGSICERAEAAGRSYKQQVEFEQRQKEAEMR